MGFCRFLVVESLPSVVLSRGNFYTINYCIDAIVSGENRVLVGLEEASNKPTAVCRRIVRSDYRRTDNGRADYYVCASSMEYVAEYLAA